MRQRRKKSITAALLTLAVLFGMTIMFDANIAFARGGGQYGGPYGRRDIDRVARDNGRRSGFAHGDSDGRLRRPHKPRSSRAYKDGKEGYYRELGSKKQYKRSYQNAFISGYDDGYRRSYRGHRGDYRSRPRPTPY